MTRKFDIHMEHEQDGDSHKYSLLVGNEKVAWFSSTSEESPAAALSFLITLAAKENNE